MADYRAIKGLYIQNVSSDPSNLVAGDIWYNSTLGKLRGAKAAAGAWASGGNMNTARSHAGGAGDKTAAVIAGDANVSADKIKTETYDGSSWTNANDLNSTKEEAGSAGSSTSAGVFGGGSANSETWDGTNWTETANLSASKYGIAGGGANAEAMIAIGGGDPVTANCEQFDGSSWTEVANINSADQYKFGQMGPSTACLGAGGYNGPGVHGRVEEWDNTSWTEIADLNTGRRTGVSAGTTTLALVYGGTSGGAVDNVESWDGSSWTEVADLSTARYASSQGQGVGYAPTALCSGGDTTPGKVATTEEWSGAPIQAANWDTT